MSPYDDPAVSAGEIADYLHSQAFQPMRLTKIKFLHVVPANVLTAVQRTYPKIAAPLLGVKVSCSQEGEPIGVFLRMSGYTLARYDVLRDKLTHQFDPLDSEAVEYLAHVAVKALRIVNPIV